MKNKFKRHLVGFEPIYGKVLFLGTSVGGNSMDRKFYYMDKRNKFWNYIDNICNTNFFSNKKEEYLSSINDDEKKERIRNEIKEKLGEYGIGISDVIRECDNTTNSSDNGIINVSYNTHLKDLIDRANVVV